MNPDTQAFNNKQSAIDKQICDRLANIINSELTEAENKIWHRHPVWFLDGNPTVGYSKLKDCVRMMFWSGADFEEEKLKPGTGKFKDASIRYTSPEQIDKDEVIRWLRKSREVQWDYKNIVKRKGKLIRLR